MLQQTVSNLFHLKNILTKATPNTFASGATCKTPFSFNLYVMLKFLSSEYQLYACGKIFRMP